MPSSGRYERHVTAIDGFRSASSPRGARTRRSIVYFRFRATGGTRLEIIPLRNSRTIPSAKLIFQRRSRSSGSHDGSRRSYPAGLTPPSRDFPEQQPTDLAEEDEGRGREGEERRERKRHSEELHENTAEDRRVVGEEEEESRRGYKYTRHLQLTFTG